MKRLPPPEILLRQWLENPFAVTGAAFLPAGVFLGIATWCIHRNLRHNEPGLRAPVALLLALIISVAGWFGAIRLPAQWIRYIGGSISALAGVLFFYADHRRFVCDPAGTIVADRWRVVLSFAGFRWTRDKANRHFFFSGDTGSGKTSGMNGLLAALIRRNPTLGGVVMANKGDEWFYLEWLAKKYGREQDIIHLRPRLVGESDQPVHRLNVTGDARFPFTTRARILVDTATALNPKDEKGFFKVKGAGHISRAFELLSDIGRPVTATNAYDLLTHGTHVEVSSGTDEKAMVAARYGDETASGVHYRVFGKYSEHNASLSDAESADDWRLAHAGFRSDWSSGADNTYTLQGDLYRGNIGQHGPAINIIGRVGPTGDLEARVSGGNILGRWRHQYSNGAATEFRAYYTRKSSGSFTVLLAGRSAVFGVLAICERV